MSAVPEKRKVGAQPGNTNAKGKTKKPWKRALERAMKREEAMGVPEGRRYLDRAAEAVLTACAVGDLDAIKLVGDRLDGRARQEIDVSVEDSTGRKLLEAEARLRQLRLARHPGNTIDNDTGELVEAELVEDDPWLK